MHANTDDYSREYPEVNSDFRDAPSQPQWYDDEEDDE